MRKWIVGFGVFTLALSTAPTLEAQGYGQSVAAGEDEVFVGESLNEVTPGYVYVYRKDQGGDWTEAQRLQASNAAQGDHFGRSLVFAGDQLLVGSTSLESIYVFEKDGSGVWNEVKLIQVSDMVEGDYIGRLAAGEGDWALQASWANQESRGAVYVFHRDESGEWSEHSKLMGTDVEPNEWFGQSLAVDGDIALIGVPRKNGDTGIVFVYRYDPGADAWVESTVLTGDGTGENSQFGSSVAIRDGRAVVGAVGEDDAEGRAYSFALDEESGAWRQVGRISPFDEGNGGSQFASAFHFGDREIWSGAPGADGSGRIYRLMFDDDGTIGSASKIAGERSGAGDGFGAVFSVNGELAVVGVIGDDYGLGSAAILERSGGQWVETGSVASEVETMAAITGDRVSCADGSAAQFECKDVDIEAFLPVQDIGGARGVVVNDIWGWEDPETGREYALVGRTDGTSFVDISDAGNPIYVGDLPMTEGSRGTSWRDIKTYANHAFIVSDNAGPHGVQVFDLTRLRGVSQPTTFTEDAHYDGIFSAHNIVINEQTGFAFTVGNSGGGETCGGGSHMIDVRDPKSPTFAGCFAHAGTGGRGTGYTHDGQCVEYRGPDEEYQGREICFGANETTLSIADVTDKADPRPIASASYPSVAYAHQGWLSEDHRYFYMNDEGDELSNDLPGTRTLIWDVEDLDDPLLAAEHFGETKATDHNLYVRGNFMYQSNYLAGLRILDISDPINPVEVGYIDTVPYGENNPAMSGSWSNYPFFRSGAIIVTSGREGLFVVRKRPTIS